MKTNVRYHRLLSSICRFNPYKLQAEEEINPRERMRNNQLKAKILIIGPENVGKSRIANFLADMNFEVPEELRPTEALRILEYDVNNVDVNGEMANIDVQLWDTSGNEKCVSYWPFLRKNADGIVFVYSAGEEDCAKKLDYMHNYFVSQQNFSLRACLVCGLDTNESNIKLRRSAGSSQTLGLALTVDNILQVNDPPILPCFNAQSMEYSFKILTELQTKCDELLRFTQFCDKQYAGRKR